MSQNEADLYARYILMYLQNEDRDTPLFRSFVTLWDSHRRGKDFLNRAGRHQWFSYLSSRYDRGLLTCDFVSEKAADLIRNKPSLPKKELPDSARLTVDHCVPLKVLREEMKRRKWTDASEIKSFLSRYLKIGAITREEDRKLTTAKLGSKMPHGSSFEDHSARYDAIGLIGRWKSGADNS